MSDLVKFFAARLDEREAVAKAATPGPWEATGQDILSRSDDPHWARACAANANGADAAHIAHHDPVRMLREVKAGRTILAMWQEPETDRYLPTGEVVAQVAVADAIGSVVRTLAAVDSDHRDYDPEWDPDF